MTKLDEVKRIPKTDRLLTDEEQDACTPTKEQLESYLATPNDKIAESLTETERRLVARCILYGQNIAQAQRDLTAPIVYKQGYDDACKVKDAEIARLKVTIEATEKAALSIKQLIEFNKDAECQERVGGMLTFIEWLRDGELVAQDDWDLHCEAKYQAFKEQAVK